MTLQSRKNRQITVLMFRRETPGKFRILVGSIGLFVGMAIGHIQPIMAQQVPPLPRDTSQDGFRPVRRFGTLRSPNVSKPNPITQKASDLRWRAVKLDTRSVTTRPQPRRETGTIEQTVFQGSREDGFSSPPPSLNGLDASDPSFEDQAIQKIFDDDALLNGKEEPSVDQVRPINPGPKLKRANDLENLPTPNNQLGELLDSENPFESDYRSTDDVRDSGMVDDFDAEEDEDPDNDDLGYGNPFNNRNDKAAPTDRPQPNLNDKENQQLACESFRDRVENLSIENISLDISPPFKPHLVEQSDSDRHKRQFAESQMSRQWRSIDGVTMAQGRFKDLANQHVVVEADHGGIETLPFSRLSEQDQVYVSENWGIPFACQSRRTKYEPRDWAPIKFCWKASGLCHKPAYFEDVNLERYGHTAGPLAQPLISSAHFFANIAVAPYKMGIHPPGECQYALGYYRPGNCAPWIVPPVPLSLRGAAAQAAVVGGLIGLVP